MKEIQEGYDLLVRGGNAAVGCLSMWADILRGEYYCGNLLRQSSLTLLFRQVFSLTPGGDLSVEKYRCTATRGTNGVTIVTRRP